MICFTLRKKLTQNVIGETEMTKHQADELDYKHKRDYDIEHMNEEDYTEKYNLWGSPTVWIFGICVVFLIVLAIVLIN